MQARCYSFLSNVTSSLTHTGPKVAKNLSDNGGHVYNYRGKYQKISLQSCNLLQVCFYMYTDPD